MPRTWVAAALFVVSLALREAFARCAFVDVDAFTYARMAADFHQGAWPVRAGDYWPLLYGFLSGLMMHLVPDALAACVQVSALASALQPPLLYLGARWLMPQGPRGLALLAGGALAVYPQAVWYAAAPRTDALYGTLYLGAAVLTCRAGGTLAGAAWGLAYLTRFEALLGAALSVPRLRRGALVAFALVAVPYAAWLSFLAGAPSVVPAAKVRYDAAEAAWTLRNGTDAMQRFTWRAGLHGDIREMSLPAGPSLGEVARGVVAGLPAQVEALCWNLSPLVLGLCALGLRRPPAVWMLPALVLPLAVFWDPHPRYYAFCIPFAMLIACAGLLGVEGRRAWALCGLLAGLGWHVAPALHPDDHVWLGPDAGGAWWPVLACGAVGAALLAAFPRRGALLGLAALVWAQGLMGLHDENARHARMLTHPEADAALRGAAVLMSSHPWDAQRLGVEWAPLPPVREGARFQAEVRRSGADLVLVDSVDLQQPAYDGLAMHVGGLREIARVRHGWEGLETRVYATR